MTREEAETVVLGTPVLVRGRFIQVDEDNDILLAFDNFSGVDNAFASIKNVALVPEARMPSGRSYRVVESDSATAVYVQASDSSYLYIPYGTEWCLYRTREQALAAAQAECNRLNAENGKEEA